MSRLTLAGAPTLDRLRYREFPESTHMMRPQDWEEATRDAAEWLVRFLSSEPPRRALR